jgi:bifunctional non-homologous end joining protein LigD
LVSRKGQVFKRFATLAKDVQAALHGKEAVIDGEIVCLDSCGKLQFYELLRTRRDCYLYAFDLLMLDGQDLRELPLIERKQALRRIVPKAASRLLYGSCGRGRRRSVQGRLCERPSKGSSPSTRVGPTARMASSRLG